MKLGGNLPPGQDALLFSISGPGLCYMPSRTDTAGHTKAGMVVEINVAVHLDKLTRRR